MVRVDGVVVGNLIADPFGGLSSEEHWVARSTAWVGAVAVHLCTGLVVSLAASGFLVLSVVSTGLSGFTQLVVGH